MSIFRPYSDFKYQDFQSVLQELRLEPFKRGKRLTRYGDMQDTVYVVLAGRIVLAHPNEVLMQILADGPTEYKERVEILSEK